MGTNGNVSFGEYFISLRSIAVFGIRVWINCLLSSTWSSWCAWVQSRKKICTSQITVPPIIIRRGVKLSSHWIDPLLDRFYWRGGVMDMMGLKADVPLTLPFRHRQGISSVSWKLSMFSLVDYFSDKMPIKYSFLWKVKSKHKFRIREAWPCVVLNEYILDDCVLHDHAMWMNYSYS